jgi:hypothetical protein
MFSALHLPSARKINTADINTAHAYTTTTGHLFITDRLSKWQFLVDTGSDLYVHLYRLIPRCEERVNYNICVANVTTIPTYRWLPLSLSMELCWDFMW